MYRYYLPSRDAKEGHGASGVRMLPAGEIEEAVLVQVRAILRSPDIVAGVWRELCSRADPSTASMTEAQVAVALGQVERIWDQLFPLEQHRLVALLVERVVVSPTDLQVKMRPNGIQNLATNVIRNAKQATAAEEEIAA